MKNSIFLINILKNLLVLILLFTETHGQSNSNFKPVKIGNQEWMVENLNVDRFRNGDIIPQAKTKEEWQKADQSGKPAWCYYDNSESNCKQCGKLYNFHAVKDPRGLAPEGWHIPSYEEWATLDKNLINYGHSITSGKKAKNGWKSWETGGRESGFVRISCPNCEYWNKEYRSKVPCTQCKDERYIIVPKTYNDPIIKHSGNGTNSSGFSAFPCGYRNDYGGFSLIGEKAQWWTNYSYYDGSDYNYRCQYYYLRYDNSDDPSFSYSFKGYGLSVRCIKDK
jgi:uncharacterized protein (TIGR02145 family)